MQRYGFLFFAHRKLSDKFRFRELIYAFLVRIRAGLAANADRQAVEWERRRSGRLAGHLVGAEFLSIFAYPQKETPGIAAALGRDNQIEMNWIILIVAGLCECGFTFCLGKAKLASGWDAAGWYAGFVVVSALSMLLLAKAAKTIPIGAIGTVLIGILVFKEPTSFWRLFFIFTLIASVIGLRMV